MQLFWTPLAINFFIELLMVSLLTGYFAVRLANATRVEAAAQAIKQHLLDDPSF